MDEASSSGFIFGWYSDISWKIASFLFTPTDVISFSLINKRHYSLLKSDPNNDIWKEIALRNYRKRGYNSRDVHNFAATHTWRSFTYFQVELDFLKKRNANIYQPADLEILNLFNNLKYLSIYKSINSKLQHLTALLEVVKLENERIKMLFAFRNIKLFIQIGNLTVGHLIEADRQISRKGVRRSFGMLRCLQPCKRKILINRKKQYFDSSDWAMMRTTTEQFMTELKTQRINYIKAKKCQLIQEILENNEILQQFVIHQLYQIYLIFTYKLLLFDEPQMGSAILQTKRLLIPLMSFQPEVPVDKDKAIVTAPLKVLREQLKTSYVHTIFHRFNQLRRQLNIPLWWNLVG